LASKQFFNGVATSCVSAITSGQTSITGQSTSTWSSSGDYIVRIDGFAPGTSTAIFENVLVTANNQGTGVLTVTRGSDGTNAQAFAANATLTPVVSAKMLTDAFARIDGGTGSAVVKLDDQSTASGASVTLTVPGGTAYHVLEIHATGRSDQAGATSLVLQFNADTGANYDYQYTDDSNVTLSQTVAVAQTTGIFGGLVASGSTAGAIAGSTVTIYNTDSTSQRKNWTFAASRWDTDAAASAHVTLGQGQWRNTANAVTTIKVFAGIGNLINFRAILYGRP
jgi:hypothetical protein